MDVDAFAGAVISHFFGGFQPIGLYGMDEDALSAALQSMDEIEDPLYLRMEGLQPVLAHPERYIFYQNAFDRKKGVEELQTLIEMGCEMQLNVLSLTGAYGEGSLALVHWLLDNGLYRFIGTDVHARSQIDLFNRFQLTPARMDKVRQLARNNETIFE